MFSGKWCYIPLYSIIFGTCIIFHIYSTIIKWKMMFWCEVKHLCLRDICNSHVSLLEGNPKKNVLGDKWDDMGLLFHYHLVICDSLLLKMAIEIVDLPIKKLVDLSIVFCMFTRVYLILWDIFHHSCRGPMGPMGPNLYPSKSPCCTPKVHSYCHSYIL